MNQRPTSLHLRSAGNLSKCGKAYRAEIMTDNRDLVTCLSCRRTWEVNGPRPAQSQAMKRALAAPTYGDGTFAGNGLLRCHICDRPYVEHRVSERCI